MLPLSYDDVIYLKSSDVLFDAEARLVSGKIPASTDVIKQIQYGYHGLCWHHDLIPVMSIYKKDEIEFEYTAKMSFPTSVIEDCIAELDKKHIYAGHVDIDYLIMGKGMSEEGAMLDAIARYGLANDLVKHRVLQPLYPYGHAIHVDSGMLQVTLEEPYVAKMLTFRTLDELELLLSAEGYSMS
jgi:hypothetical protein